MKPRGYLRSTYSIPVCCSGGKPFGLARFGNIRKVPNRQSATPPPIIPNNFHIAAGRRSASSWRRRTGSTRPYVDTWKALLDQTGFLVVKRINLVDKQTLHRIFGDIGIRDRSDCVKPLRLHDDAKVAKLRNLDVFDTDVAGVALTRTRVSYRIARPFFLTFPGLQSVDLLGIVLQVADKLVRGRDHRVVRFCYRSAGVRTLV